MNVLYSMKKIRNLDTLDTWVDSVAIKTVRYETRKRKVRRLFWVNSSLPSDDTADCRDRGNAFEQSHIQKRYRRWGGW